ncbi:hypothetical protein HGRIS_011832 [Hohenbuehelia grisea]|uniref:Uncharacterized protein n=1 Tax=Hohenbuehelia grisea TaxID=104357 RepID=A0ABR3JWA5_9AGAR
MLQNGQQKSMEERLPRTNADRRPIFVTIQVQNSGNVVQNHTVDSYNNLSVTDNSSGHTWTYGEGELGPTGSGMVNLLSQ